MLRAERLFASVLGSAAVALSPLVAAAQVAIPNADQSANRNVSGPQKLVDQSTQVVQRMRHDPHLSALMARAQGVLIIPKYGMGAFVVGAKSGEGVLLVHENGGRWSSPAFYNLAGGDQVGGEAGPLVYILMTPRAVRSLASAGNVSLNRNAGFTIVTWNGKTQGKAQSKAQSEIGAADVVLWSGAEKGIEPKPGKAVGASNLSQDFAANDQYYRARHLDTVAVLQGRVFNSGAAPLQQSLAALG